MALPCTLIFVALISVLCSSISMAEEFIVGDDHGWTIGFDYQAWASDKVFRVGDKLIFKYPTGKHNVFRVSGPNFRNCTVPSRSHGWAAGEDVIVLDSPGRRWYLCGVGTHCQSGQKLFINVLPSQTASPSPSPLPSVLPITLAPSPASWAPSPSSFSAHDKAHFGRWVHRKIITIFRH